MFMIKNIKCSFILIISIKNRVKKSFLQKLSLDFREFIKEGR